MDEDLLEKRVTHTDRILARKAGIEGWRWYAWERVGTTNDSIYKGCVPNGVYSRGPRKGRPRYQGGTYEMKLVVTEAEFKAEAAAYEKETGNCAECYGTGQEWAGWSADAGSKFRECRRCKGSGTTPPSHLNAAGG